MEKYFHAYSALNLKMPMVGCGPNHSRTLIHQGDLRFKDNAKEASLRLKCFIIKSEFESIYTK